MPRKIDSIGDKWDAGYRESIDDAKEAYNEALPTMAQKLIDKTDDMGAAYTAAVGNASL